MSKTCGKGEQTVYFDIVGLYPTANALDEYAVRHRKHINASVEDINLGDFIRRVKCEVIPNKNLHIPVPYDNDNGKLLFHNNNDKNMDDPRTAYSFTDGVCDNPHIRCCVVHKGQGSYEGLCDARFTYEDL